LGDASTTNSPSPLAVDTSGVLAGKTLTAISTGYAHTCAVAEGRAYCWGGNGDGQLGTNSTTDSPVPVAVNAVGVLAGKTVTTISAGTLHTCAVADGKAYCWGANFYGRLGNNSTIGSKVPVAVDATGVLAGKTITAITAGEAHTCAVADGQAYCWGWNGYGQLGDDSTTNSQVPVAVNTTGVLVDKAAAAISAGYAHSCAVAEGRAYCWGFNSSGQLGNASTTNSQVPVAVNAVGVLAGKTVTEISAGGLHTCAVADGRAYCWGENGDGQLGNNKTTASLVPVAVDSSGVLAGRTVSAASAGRYHSCALAEGRASCWGRNAQGQLGNDSTANALVPVPVDTSGLLNTKTVTAIQAGEYHTAVLFAGVPMPPPVVTAVAGDGQATVSWTAPADDGGMPVLEYEATAIPGGAACTTATTSCAVTGLTNGTPYVFTVTARNAVGTSPPSAPSAPVIPTAPVTPAPIAQQPAKVTGVKAKVKKGRLRVTWKEVSGATSYRVRISQPGGKKYKAWKTTTKRVFKAKLRKGKKYRFQVAAVGAGGRGPVATIRFRGK
jgi:alpha-tubulin suppressor-like RCC1 family protein